MARSNTDGVEKVIALVILIGILTLHAYQYYTLARELHDEEVKRNGKGYVSDEVWYVSSARNILNKVFKIKPRITDGKYGVTIIYNQSVASRAVVENYITSKYGNSVQLDSNYREIAAIYVESSNLTILEELVEKVNASKWLVDAVWGWRLADARNINTYLNLEHPPLAKYLIALLMTVFGDNPLTWRIPSIVAGVLTTLFTYMAASALTRNRWLSLVVSLLAGVDPVMRALSSIALLDVYVAMFSAVSTYFLFSKKPVCSLVTVIVGSLFKFNTLFLLIPVLYMLVRRDYIRNPKFTTLIHSLIRYSLGTLTLFLAFQVIASTPLIIYGGFDWWFSSSITGAFKWHLSVKCTGVHCPVSSAPWDWFIGNNGFTLYYFTGTRSLVAIGFWPLWSIALAYSVLLLPLYRVDKRLGYALLVFHGLLIGYILLYIAGGRTQYSFYSVQFAPIVYLLLVVALTYAIVDPSKLRYAVVSWLRAITAVWNFIVNYILLAKT